MEKHEHKRAVINRMARAIGHLGAVKKMIELNLLSDECLIIMERSKDISMFELDIAACYF